MVTAIGDGMMWRLPPISGRRIPLVWSTASRLRACFSCIYPMLLDALLDVGWEFTSVEQVHEFFKAQMTADKVVNKHTGEIIQFPASTAQMDTLTFSTYCEQLRTYAREFLNVEIPDPDKFWRINKTSNHNEKV